jgi:hypothetical protein
VLPDLRYVDLPDGVFADEPSCMALKQELEIRCSELRKTKFLRGSERAFTSMAERRLWRNLEALEVEGVDVEADALLYTLGSFPSLREVKLANMLILNDELLIPNPSFSLFPAVERLVLEKAPAVTAAGLCSLLSRPILQRNLLSLTLKDTGVLPQELHLVLGTATYLIELSLSDTVERPFPLSPIPPLASATLETLFFGILPDHITANPPVSESYYTYMARSLLANGLPALSSLFAYSDALPQSLSAALLSSPELPFAGHSRNGSSTGEATNNPFLRPPAPFGTGNLAARLSTYSISSYYQSGSPNGSRPSTSSGPPALNLDLYTKPPSQPELEWSLTQLRSTAPTQPIQAPPSAPPTVQNYTPTHFSTPNVRSQSHHVTNNGVSGNDPSSNVPSFSIPHIGSPIPPTPTNCEENNHHTSNGNIVENSLAPSSHLSTSHSSPPIPSHTISSTRPLSTLLADHKQQNSESSTYRPSRTSSIQPHTSFSLPNFRDSRSGTQHQSRTRVALQPIDAYAIGRIGSGRVQSGRVASGVASSYGGFPAVPREWIDNDYARNSGVYGDEKGGHERQGSGASWRSKRKGGLIGDWMG